METQKREEGYSSIYVCKVCRKPLPFQRKGRRRVYCSNACKMSDWRRKPGGYMWYRASSRNPHAPR